VKRLLHRIRAAGPQNAESPSGFFSSKFDEASADSASPRTSWSERATLVDAQPMDRHEGRQASKQIFDADPPTVNLSREERDELLHGFQYAHVASGRELITQDERGDFLVLLLGGQIAVDRVQLWGDRVKLGEARAGDVLGEMSLLDAGPRFSTCTTLRDCRIAVLDAPTLDRFVRDEPRIALALVTFLARRMSLRLRHASTRLTAMLVRR
jgi:CRP/FNR family transcriptional regulator, cyclic AMP receptor protein